jgi:hypothetical protein
VAALVDSQWLAAQLASDHAVHAYLQAIPLSSRPALALDGIKRITSYLREPNWLLALQAGQPAQSEEAHWLNTIRRRGPRLQLLSRFGAPLQERPTACHRCCADRSRTIRCRWRTGYATGAGTAPRPEHAGRHPVLPVPALAAATRQWKTSSKAGWCRGLDLAQSNALRWRKAQDWLAESPQRDDSETVAAHERAYAQILDWHLDRNLRAEVLTQRAGLRYRLGRIEGPKTRCSGTHSTCRRCSRTCSRRWALDRDRVLHDGLSNLEACTWFAPSRVPKRCSPRWWTMPHAKAIRRSACSGPRLRRAWAAWPDRRSNAPRPCCGARWLAPQDNTSAVTFAANLFCDVSQAAGLSLLQRMTEAGDAGAMSALCDLYKGRLGGRDQPQFVDAGRQRTGRSVRWRAAT